MTVTQATLDAFEAATTAANEMVAGTEADVTLPDQTVVGNILKQLNAALGSGYLRDNQDETLAGSLTIDDFLEIADPNGTANEKRVRWFFEEGALRLQFLNDAGVVISSPFAINEDQITAYLGKGKVLSTASVDHAGGIINCGPYPNLVAGNGLTNPLLVSGQTGHFTVELTTPVSDFSKAAPEITMSTESQFGLQYRPGGQMVDNKTVFWTVQDNTNAFTNAVCQAHITIKDYS